MKFVCNCVVMTWDRKNEHRKIEKNNADLFLFSNPKSDFFKIRKMRSWFIILKKTKVKLHYFWVNYDQLCHLVGVRKCAKTHNEKIFS